MSSIGMMGANILESLVSHATQSHSRKFKQDFDQLGQDLQSGNVTRGQADLTALQTDISSLPSSSSSNVNSQSFNQLAQDLQSGNLSAAKTDYADLQQTIQQGAGHGHHFHAHASVAGGPAAQAQQALAQLGQALQSGNLSAAQQAYAAFQTDTAAFGAFGGNASSGASSLAGAALNASA